MTGKLPLLCARPDDCLPLLTQNSNETSNAANAPDRFVNH